MKLSKFKLWFLRKILADLFIQGPEHHRNAALLYALIHEVWDAEFTEDNRYTTDAMLREAFEAAQFAPKLDNNEVYELRKFLKKG